MTTTSPSDELGGGEINLSDRLVKNGIAGGMWGVPDPLGLLPFTKEIGENESGKSIEGRVFNEPYRN